MRTSATRRAAAWWVVLPAIALLIVVLAAVTAPTPQVLNSKNCPIPPLPWFKTFDPVLHTEICIDPDNPNARFP